MYKISFCTVVRNRLNHLKETLRENLRGNSNYKDLEFVILDYNSNDGLEQWMMDNYLRDIQAGRITYYRTFEPEFFHRSHSRNIAFRLAKGDLLCNLDADNFTGNDFAQHISDSYQVDENIYLVPGGNEEVIKQDFLGRICCKKKDFINIGGYDESMDGYGFEDHDLVNRLDKIGLVKQFISNAAFFKAIYHDDKERLKEERNWICLSKIYFYHVSPSKTDLIYLMEDGYFYRGRLIDCNTLNSKRDITVIDKLYTIKYQYTLEEIEWQSGIWQDSINTLKFSYSGKSKIEVFEVKNGSLIGYKKRFRIVKEENLKVSLIKFYSEYNNRLVMNRNLISGRHLEKNSQFGEAVIFKNFSTQVNIY